MVRILALPKLDGVLVGHSPGIPQYLTFLTGMKRRWTGSEGIQQAPCQRRYDYRGCGFIQRNPWHAAVKLAKGPIVCRRDWKRPMKTLILAAPSKTIGGSEREGGSKEGEN